MLYAATARAYNSTFLNPRQAPREDFKVHCHPMVPMLQSHRGSGDAVMLDTFRTVLARLIVQHLTRPRELVIRAWLWLAADTDGGLSMLQSL